MGERKLQIKRTDEKEKAPLKQTPQLLCPNICHLGFKSSMNRNPNYGVTHDAKSFLASDDQGLLEAVLPVSRFRTLDVLCQNKTLLCASHFGIKLTLHLV